MTRSYRAGFVLLLALAAAPSPAQTREPTRVRPSSADSASASDKPKTDSTTWENRFNLTLHGATCGSAAGSCVGSLAGIEEVSSGGWFGGDWCVNTPVYAVNHPVFWGVACGLTVLGSTAGYVMGARADRIMRPEPELEDERTDWRYGCAIGAAVPGVLLGIGVVYLHTLLNNRVAGWIDNDPDGLTVLPGALTGLCVAVELATIGYRYGRDIDRRKAMEAAAKRRVLVR